jgi:MFS family permease
MQDEIVEPPGSHEPTEHAKTPKKAAASGWIGSALEYYDFFIYAQAASLVFPLIFFPSTNPQVAIVASFATFGVGYAARPLGAFVLGYWGDKHWPQERARAVHVAHRRVDLPRRAPPDLRPGRDLRPDPAGDTSPGPGLRGRRGDRRRQRHDHRALAVRTARVLRQLHPAGVQAGQVFAAAIFLPLAWAMPPEAFQSWGWRIPFLLSVVVVIAGYIIRRRVDETPAFQEEADHGEIPQSPIASAFKESGGNMARVAVMALMNVIGTTVVTFGTAFATNPSYGVGMSTTQYLLISVCGNIIAVIVIPFVGNLSDKIGRRPCMIVGSVGSAILGYPYLYFVGQDNFWMAFVFAMLMWGVIYQGYNAVFPAFYQELFPDEEPRHGVRHRAERRHAHHGVPARHLHRARRPDARGVCGGEEVRAHHGASLRPDLRRSRLRGPVRRRLDGRHHHAGHRHPGRGHGLLHPGDLPDPL